MKRMIATSGSFLILLGASFAWAGRAHAGTPAAIAVPGWGIAASSQRLDTVRGGFGTDSGLLASFGIERAIYVNGQLVTRTDVYIPDIGRMNAAQAGELAAVIGSVNVIQNGAGNSFDPSALEHTTAATVIQNSRSNQDIRSLTTLSTTVNTLDMFKQMNWQSTLQTALVNSLGH